MRDHRPGQDLLPGYRSAPDRLEGTAPGGTWWIRPLALLAVIGAGVVLALVVGVPTVGEIRGWVQQAGWAAPVLYAVAYAALTLAPVPATVLTIAAGVLFGLPLGIVVVLAGAGAGAGIAFALARVLGRAAVAGIGSARLHRLDALLRRRGLLAVIGVRLVPLFPFTALNYACGLSGVRPRDYLLGTAVGILPATAAYVTIGAFGTTPGSIPVLLAVGGLVALAVVGTVANRRRVADTAVAG
jgi:uncharacterized membrane protein YdjX (TVP38/TMEM64 family)